MSLDVLNEALCMCFLCDHEAIHTDIQFHSKLIGDV